MQSDLALEILLAVPERKSHVYKRMKKLLIAAAVLIISGAAFYACAAQATVSEIGVKPETPSPFSTITVSPYYTVAFENFNGRAKSGFGLDLGVGLSKTVQIVGFAETSDTQEDVWIDRVGAGAQVTGKLGKYLKPYGRFSVGYALDGSSGMARDEWFLRPEFGVLVDVFHYERTTVSLAGAWALDVDMNGNAAQRLKAGLSISF